MAFSAIPPTLAIVLAGGEGRRLEPLTRERAKPAVPFGGRYRIIDFVLSNLVNSNFRRIKILTQYKSESLNQHITRGWRLTSMFGNYIECVPAQMRTGPRWFQGSADAVYQNLNLILDESPEYVVVFGADHVYRMEVRQMLEFHVDTKAECTVAAIPQPKALAPEFGVIEVDEHGKMIGFQEKPKVEDARTIPGRPDMILASMGNYIFTRQSLVDEIEDDAKKESAHDFGKSIIAEIWKRRPTFIYDFATNQIPGQGLRERGFWRDVGTLDAYFQTNMDLIEVDPIFNLYNDLWPIHTHQLHAPPAKFVFSEHHTHRVGTATDSLVSEGCIVSGGKVHKCVLSPKVRVNSYSTVEESILFENVTIGRHCRIRRAIIDKNVEVPPGTTIGYDLEADKKRFFVGDGNIVVIPKGTKLQAKDG